MAFHQLGLAQQLLQGVGEALDLKELGPLDPAGCAHDGVAGADNDCGIGVNAPRPFLEFAREAVMQAAECHFLGVAEVEVREQPPQPD